MITEKDFEDLDEYALDAGQMEAAERMRNLMWTVSGDYTLNTKLDLQDWKHTKWVAAYDAVKQGALAKFFDQNAFAVYLAKKLYYGADQGPLTAIAQMCVDAAVYPRAVRERPGVREIRSLAYDYILERKFSALSASWVGRVRLAWMRDVLREGAVASNGVKAEAGVNAAEHDEKEAVAETADAEESKMVASGHEQRLAQPLARLGHLEADASTWQLIRTVDELYNEMIDPDFVKKHGDLEHVLSATLEEMQEFNWRDLLEEEAYEQLLQQLLEQVSREDFQPDQPATAPPEQGSESAQAAPRVIQIDEKAAAKMYAYIEKNYGRSYLNEHEQKALNYRLCRGAHQDCRLYMTDGILESHVMVNAQYVNTRAHVRNNQRLFMNSTHLLRRNVEEMSAALRRSLMLRSQPEAIYAEHGHVRPNQLWKVGRVPEPGKLFFRMTRENNNDFVVEVLLDASGSQRERQGLVALQAYIICAALSEVGLPHRLVSFCTFWDYTVLQRMRDFDDAPDKDRKALEYVTSSNNRDGLAIRAAGDELSRRPEEHKILIVLSDGRPNDVVVGRPGSRNPQSYSGDYAVRDTAFEVRRLRSQGIHVLGVYTGKEQDLAAEKLIFGRDFAYIHEIRNFSRVVSTYLQRLLEQDVGEL
ncbi:MAG: nitric oxide reductase activation protein [Lachnospiraceae bacterium]|nr:nitric oxide reductase activation protein [Lachnospiraceae bacterium]